MASWATTLRFAIVSGSIASATSTVALALLARAESKGALQPVNSTSHWLNGEQAGLFRQGDLAHTAVGYATHHAATIFWAVLFERWIGARPIAALPLAGDALAMAVVAAAVDYGATPKRFTPGWEVVLSKRSMAVAYAAMAVGLAAGALMNRRTDQAVRKVGRGPSPPMGRPVPRADQPYHVGFGDRAARSRAFADHLEL